MPQKSPYATDANTLLLEHFDNSTSGTPYGDVTYTNGFFAQAAHLVQGAYIELPPPPLVTDGQTIEFWGKLDALSTTNHGSFVQVYRGEVVQTLWIGDDTSPRAGYIYQFSPLAGVDVPSSAPGLPRSSLGWHHYAMTWGQQGFHFYYDGVHVYSATNTEPIVYADLWVVGGWIGGESYDPGVFGAVDELRISNIQRTFVPARMLQIQPIPSAVVLRWPDPTFALQSAPSPTATFTNVPGATSPHTNSLAGDQKYFRLVQ